MSVEGHIAEMLELLKAAREKADDLERELEDDMQQLAEQASSEGEEIGYDRGHEDGYDSGQEEQRGEFYSTFDTVAIYLAALVWNELSQSGCIKRSKLETMFKKELDAWVDDPNRYFKELPGDGMPLIAPPRVGIKLLEE